MREFDEDGLRVSAQAAAVKRPAWYAAKLAEGLQATEDLGAATVGAPWRQEAPQRTWRRLKIVG